MAQLLKPEVRNKIIESSKNEFLKYGYENASMRHIAKEAGMTVGNLYRYFDSKESINKEIVTPTLNKINDLVKKITDKKVDLEKSNFSIKFTKDSIKKMLDELSENLIDIYQESKDEFNILLLHSEVNENLVKWFSDLVLYFIDTNYKIVGFKKEKKLMARAFAVSIFDGIKEFFKDNSINRNYLKLMVKSFLYAYTEMLDLDIKKLGVI